MACYNKSSYQRLRDEVGDLIDRDIANHEFLCNVEARLTVIRTHLQKHQQESAKRKLSKLLTELSERLSPSDGVPF